MEDINLMANKYPKKIDLTYESSEKLNKWKVSAIAAVIAIILFSTFIFKFTNNLFGDKIEIAHEGSPTIKGLLLHGVVFFIILRIILW